MMNNQTAPFRTWQPRYKPLRLIRQRKIIYAIAVVAMILVGSANADLLHRIPPGDVAMDFTLPDSQGKLHHLKQYRGKHVLVMFWTVDCHYCKEDMNSLELIYPRFKALGLEILAVHAGDKTEAVREMLELSPLSYPILMDIELSLSDWSVPAIPTTYIIQPDGQRHYRAIGSRDWSQPEMTDLIEAMLLAGKSL